MLNYYRMMGVGPSASQEELKAAYRRLARQHHPDRFASGSADEYAAATERFQLISEAYRLLSHERARRQYTDDLREYLRRDRKFLCDACGMVNRIPKRFRKGQEATCGTCGSILPLTESDLEELEATREHSAFDNLRREAKSVGLELARAGAQILIKRYLGNQR